MAKFEILAETLAYQCVFYRQGAVVDFGPEADVKGLEAAGFIGPVGSLEKVQAAANKAEQEHAEWEAERDERERSFNQARHESQQGVGTAPNVSSQDGPQVTRPSGRPGNRRR